MKNLVLENENYLDDRIEDVLKYQFKQNQEIWLQFRFAFWPENRKETLKKLLLLNSNDNIICQTVFNGMDQTELMIDALIELKKNNIKINFFVISNLMIEDLIKYTKSYPFGDKEKEQERLQYLQKMQEVLQYHNIYNINSKAYYSEELEKTEEDFKKACIHILPETIGL